jgi:hypothetical protein
MHSDEESLDGSVPTGRYNAHIFIISQESDFHILTNELKKYTKVKTHLMTSIIQRSFVNGLVDVVVYYKSAFESRNQKRTLSLDLDLDLFSTQTSWRQI